MSQQIAPGVKRLLMVQCLVGFALACLLLLYNLQMAYSALLGSVCCFIPNVYLALRVFDMSKGRSAHATLRAFYIGATGKFVVTVALFIGVFQLVSPLSVPAMFGGFVVVQAVVWATPLFAVGNGGQCSKAPR